MRHGHRGRNGFSSIDNLTLCLSTSTHCFLWRFNHNEFTDISLGQKSSIATILNLVGCGCACHAGMPAHPLPCWRASSPTCHASRPVGAHVGKPPRCATWRPIIFYLFFSKFVTQLLPKILILKLICHQIYTKIRWQILTTKLYHQLWWFSSLFLSPNFSDNNNLPLNFVTENNRWQFINIMSPN